VPQPFPAWSENPGRSPLRPGFPRTHFKSHCFSRLSENVRYKKKEKEMKMKVNAAKHGITRAYKNIQEQGKINNRRK
jgi:hypothetical protein